MSKEYLLEKHQFISKSKSEVFDFFKTPENLEKITPKKLSFKIITPLPIVMRKGTLIEYKIKILGIPIYWRTLINKYNPPNTFRDTQLNGPYEIWDHTHIFKECKNGTMMIDRIVYSIPYSFIGRLANFIWVKRELKNIFNYRYKIIEEIFKEN